MNTKEIGGIIWEYQPDQSVWTNDLGQVATGRMFERMCIEPLLSEIIQERWRQDHQWGGPEHDDTHSQEDWIRFIQNQIGLAGTNANRYYVASSDYRQRLIKIAALAVAAIESYDRKKTS